MNKKYKKFKFRGLGGADVWRYGTYRQEIEYLGEKGPAIYVEKKGIYFIKNPETVGLYTGKKDKNKKEIYPGDVLENDEGVRFEVRFGKYTMYCPIDNCMMENVGFYTVAEGFYEDMPLGPTEKYATKIGNIFQNPELKVPEEFRCNADINIGYQDDTNILDMKNVTAAHVLLKKWKDSKDEKTQVALKTAIETLFLDAMDDWHESDTTLTAEEYLGLTEKEYKYWVLGCYGDVTEKEEQI